jgi:uridine kinase
MAVTSGLNARPIILGIVGDSAAGKTTLSRGIIKILGPERVSVICTDDYHRYNRKQRKELGITPLNPECNYLDVMAQHLQLLRAGEPILKPHYDHKRGDFGPPQYIVPKPFLIVEGLLGMYWQEMRNAYSVRVFLKPPEELRRRWKIRRDTIQRGYSEAEVLHELDIDDQSGCVRATLGREGGRAVEYLEIDGAIPDEPAAALERCILDHLDAYGAAPLADLGQYSDPLVRHSHPLALTQLLLVYHLLHAKLREEIEV